LARLARHADAQVDGTDRQGVAVAIGNGVVRAGAGTVHVEEGSGATTLRTLCAGAGEHVYGIQVAAAAGFAAVAGRGYDAGHEGCPAADPGTADHALARCRFVQIHVPAHRAIRQLGELLEGPHRTAVGIRADDGDLAGGQVVTANGRVIVNDAVPGLDVGRRKVADGDQLAGTEGEPDLVRPRFPRQGDTAGDRLPVAVGVGCDEQGATDVGIHTPTVGIVGGEVELPDIAPQVAGVDVI